MMALPLMGDAAEPTSGSNDGVHVEANKVMQPASVVLRGSEIRGMTVKDIDGRSIGTIEDLMVDLQHSDVRYLAVSYGGFLGLGDKLFAVPLSAFDIGTEKDSHFLVLDLPENRLKKAPGFDQNHWPSTADPKWQAEVNNYYRRDREETKSK